MREGGERLMVLAAAAREDGQTGKIGHSGEESDGDGGEGDGGRRGGDWEGKMVNLLD